MRDSVMQDTIFLKKPVHFMQTYLILVWRDSLSFSCCGCVDRSFCQRILSADFLRQGSFLGVLFLSLK